MFYAISSTGYGEGWFRGFEVIERNIMERLNVTNDEIAAYAEGVADRETAQRVLAASLASPSVRARLTLLRQLDKTITDTPRTAMQKADMSAERLAKLQASLVKSALAQMPKAPVATETPATAENLSLRERAVRLLRETAGRGGGLWGVAAETAQGVVSEVERAGQAALSLLSGRREMLTLPCLAPGAAGYPADLQVLRQTLAIGDGVRIEFQQLPSPSVNRLRVLVDASTLTAENPSFTPYNVAYLTLEEGRGDRSGMAGGSLPDRHVLVISLNPQGRGYVDFTVDGAAHAVAPTADNIPSPRSAYSLISATLSRTEH
jgi:hypothetical protein